MVIIMRIYVYIVNGNYLCGLICIYVIIYAYFNKICKIVGIFLCFVLIEINDYKNVLID